MSDSTMRSSLAAVGDSLSVETYTLRPRAVVIGLEPLDDLSDLEGILGEEKGIVLLDNRARGRLNWGVCFRFERLPGAPGDDAGRR
jgi:hypothetical protein